MKIEIKERVFLILAVFLGFGCLAVVNVGYMAFRAYWLGFESISLGNALTGLVFMIFGVYLFCFLASFFRKKLAELGSRWLSLGLLLAAILLFFYFYSELRDGPASLIRQIWLEAGLIFTLGLVAMAGVFNKSKPKAGIYHLTDVL